ncbi:MAG: hypothetical protein GY715_15280 [Planctomycetes bacterium]|nr:hypothetical protein [Planctomycetota bacterium]
MALTPPHHVHPVRRTVGWLLLLAIIVTMLIVSWNHDQLAERIGVSFQDYYDDVGRPTQRR